MKLILVFILAFPAIVSAAVVRELDGVQYNIHSDFDSADGECVLSGYEYSSGFYSYGPGGSLPVLKLNSNGGIQQILDNSNGEYEVIQGIYCE